MCRQSPKLALLRQTAAVDYDLLRLGPREFEHLTQALVLKVLGATVEVFGDGPDGGREATYMGRSSWPTGDQPDVWDGYHVVQAKFRQRPQGTPDDGWLARNIKTELDHWSQQDSNRRKKGRLPEYLLITTNVVPPAPVRRHGGDPRLLARPLCMARLAQIAGASRLLVVAADLASPEQEGGAAGRRGQCRQTDVHLLRSPRQLRQFLADVAATHRRRPT